MTEKGTCRKLPLQELGTVYPVVTCFIVNSKKKQKTNQVLNKNSCTKKHPPLKVGIGYLKRRVRQTCHRVQISHQKAGYINVPIGCKSTGVKSRVHQCIHITIKYNSPHFVRLALQGYKMKLDASFPRRGD